MSLSPNVAMAKAFTGCGARSIRVLPTASSGEAAGASSTPHEVADGDGHGCRQHAADGRRATASRALRSGRGQAETGSGRYGSCVGCARGPVADGLGAAPWCAPAEHQVLLARPSAMRDRHRRSVLGLALALGLGLQLALVPPVAACSCMGPQPMAAYAGDDLNVILAGVMEPRDGRGYPVTVTQWFKGGDLLTPRIWFDAAGFSGNDGMCGIEPCRPGGSGSSSPTDRGVTRRDGCAARTRCWPRPKARRCWLTRSGRSVASPSPPNATDPTVSPMPSAPDDAAVSSRS